jgi:hypothetical protein
VGLEYLEHLRRTWLFGVGGWGGRWWGGGGWWVVGEGWWVASCEVAEMLAGQPVMSKWGSVLREALRVGGYRRRVRVLRGCAGGGFTELW